MRYRFLVLFFLLGWFTNLQAQQTGFPTTGTQTGNGFPGTGGTFPGGGAGRPGGQGPGVGIDDSTKVIYGPKTTRFFLESDVFNNRKTLYLTDTALVGVHQFEFTQRNKNLLTDLGNLGTPLRPVYYNTPTQIGAQQGYYVFSPFGYQTDQVRYYDTKSPFTDLYLVLGGRNQNILNFDFNQNITPRLNAGFAIQRFTSERQFGLPGSTSQTQRLLAQNWGVLLHGNYRTADDRYVLLAHLNHMNHSLPEQGGNIPNSPLPGQDSITIDYEGQAKLAATLGWERRTAIHLYHQYAPAQGIQFFHKLDYLTRINNYRDDAVVENQNFSRFYDTRSVGGDGSAFIRARFGDSTRIQQDVYWQSIDNTFGVKGIFTRRGAAYNYRVYYRPRYYSQQGDYNVLSTTLVTGTGSETAVGNTPSLQRYDTRNSFENYIGGWVGYYFPDSLSRLTAEGEFLVADIGSTNTGAFRLNGQLESKYFTVGFTSVQAAPPLIAQRFISNVQSLTWTNTANQFQRTQHAYGQLTVRTKNWLVTPGADFWLIDNYVYFDRQARPAQSGAFTMLRLGLGATYTRSRFQASAQSYYTLNAGDDVLRVPTFFFNGRIQYDFIYAKVLHIQTGVQLHYKSAYYGNAYNPVTQQYYLQEGQLVEGALLADVFANMRVNRVRFFVKLNHANQGILSPSGYFVAPGFLQLQRGFGFGVDWLLFD
ncbi:hypothetical protein FAES_3310 [Fibrella aestuarina BUZ 2]|uniref:Porin n=1 Tax=Fibrella aestuarina BUZ 2 TaxID=1166018 RepID=I0KB15_9BACT|nr:putative porin [Fibrella aestuarina]CCH01318.1 hypothetical protein FAES_3310 [Fibrella aestuarina BUZ 2]